MKTESRGGHLIRSLFVTCALAFVLSGCGGGGGESNLPAARTLSGVAAVGSPIVNGSISASCAAGSTLTATTSGTGSWQVTLSSTHTLPCAVQLSGGIINAAANTTPYHAIATAPGNVNITPLTDLMVANLTGAATPNTWFVGLSTTPALLTSITQNDVDTSLTNLRAALSGLTPLSTINPITTAFTPTPGNVSDDMLTALQTAMTSSGVTYVSLLGNASAPTFTAPVAGFNTALTTAYTGTTSGSALASFPGTYNLTASDGTTATVTFDAAGNVSSCKVSTVVVCSGKLTLNSSTGTASFQVFGNDGLNPVDTTASLSGTIATNGGVSGSYSGNSVTVGAFSGTFSGSKSGVSLEPAPPAPSSGGTAAQYFTKLAVGNTWSNLSTLTTATPGQPISTTTTTSTKTSTITASTGGLVAFTNTSTSNGVTSAATNSYQKIDVIGAWVITDSTGTSSTSTRLPATFSVGTTWIVSPATATLSTINGTIAAFNVTRSVPAGTFSDCLQIDYIYTVTSGGVAYAYSGSVYLSPTAGTFVDQAYSITSSDGSTQTLTTQLQPGYVANTGTTGGGAPTVTGMSPSSGTVGTTVTINGTNFSGTLANNTVRFNGTQATVTGATTTSLTVTVPSGATTGTVSVATAGGTAASSGSFTVNAGTLTLVPAFTSMSGSGHHTIFGITANGDLWGWGDNAHGQLGNGTNNIYGNSVPKLLGSGYSSISPGQGGDSFVHGVKTDGTLMYWGSDIYYAGAADVLTPQAIGTGGFVKVASSTYSQAALKSDSSLWVWGRNDSGFAGDGTTNSISSPKQIGTGFATVSVGTTHRMAVKQDGTLWAWGSNTCGALGSTIVAGSLKVPTQIGTGYKDAVAFAGYSTIALKADGSLWSWGQQYNGQLGDGVNTSTCRSTPQQIGTGFTAIAGGYQYAMALKADGSVWSWGHLSISSTNTGADSSVPKQIGTGFVKIFMNTWRAYAIAADGGLWAWGDDYDNGFGNTSSYSAVPVRIH